MVCSSRPIELHFVRAWHRFQQDAAAPVDQDGDCKVHAKLQANLTSTLLNIPLGNENETLGSSKHQDDQKSNCYNQVSHLKRPTHDGLKVNIMPWRLGCFVSLIVGSHLAHRCMFPHFRPPVTLSTMAWFCYLGKSHSVGEAWLTASYPYALVTVYSCTRTPTGCKTSWWDSHALHIWQFHCQITFKTVWYQPYW